MIRAGSPTTNAFFGTGLVTRAAGAIVAPSPIETGPRTFAWPPIQTPSPTSGPQGFDRDPTLVCWPTEQRFPRRQLAISIPPKCNIEKPEPICADWNR